MVIYLMPEGDRPEREQLRKHPLWHGFGSLSTSTWLSPGGRRPDAHRISANLANTRVEVLRCYTDA
jgi:phenylacetic acid degradation operon negative regulatory protein